MTKLGFHAPLTRLYVFIKSEANTVWYYLDDGQKRYIEQTALTGTLKCFQIKEATTSFGSELKADFEIIADRRYVLRSGVDTVFTKGMLMTIAALSDEQLRRPITLELKAGEEKNNVLLSARDPETFEPIRTGTWENANWDNLMNQALARLGGEAPQPAPPVQSEPQVTKPVLYPQHNAIIKSIRQLTGHSADQIIGWCQGYNAQSPAELSPSLCEQLAQALAVGWGKSLFDSEEHCRNSYQGKVKTLVASGVGLGDAIASWIESVQATPVGSR